MKLRHAIVFLFLLSGCARFSTTQVETRVENGTATEIRTHVSVGTLLSGKSALTKLRTTLTEKSQGIGVGTLDQESSGTNVVAALRAIVDILEKVRP